MDFLFSHILSLWVFGYNTILPSYFENSLFSSLFSGKFCFNQFFKLINWSKNWFIFNFYLQLNVFQYSCVEMGTFGFFFSSFGLIIICELYSFRKFFLTRSKKSIFLILKIVIHFLEILFKSVLVKIVYSVSLIKKIVCLVKKIDSFLKIFWKFCLFSKKLSFKRIFFLFLELS